jgi:cellobiose phosphorylase
LGIRPEKDGLRLDPCIPAAWKHFTVTRQFRGKKLKVTVENPNGVQKGVTKLVLNGKKLPGNLIPVDALKPVNKVQVVIG